MEAANKHEKETPTKEKKRGWGSRIINFLAMGGFLVVIVLILVIIVIVSVLSK